MNKRAFIVIFILIVISLSIGIKISYSTDDDPERTPRSGDRRPILPPTVLSTSVSPTPSPHIADPNISYEILTFEKDIMHHPYDERSLLGDEFDVPETAIGGEVTGEIVNIERMDSSTYMLEIKHSGSMETIKMSVGPDDVTIIKEAKGVSFNDMNIGDTVNIMFIPQEEKISAKFISILPNKDLKNR